MIISPPFLPKRDPGETDAHYFDRAIPGGALDDGGFPMSFGGNWHGGPHFTAPAGPVVRGVPHRLPVRAIADGTVAFVRQPTAKNSNPKHPLNYRGRWTDDGCVIIEHTTDIGANTAGKATTVTFFSITMHLKSVNGALPAVGKHVYRKDVLGHAGRIYGVEHQIHMEIICDDDAIKHLLGRSQPLLSTASDGRADAVFGAMWYLIPAGTPFYGTLPGKASLPPVVHHSTKAYAVRIDLEKGDAHVQTFHLDGTPVGKREDPGFGYDMFRTAKNRYKTCQSAGYELLRFGRVLGPDSLKPADAPHWRKVAFPGGSGFVDLNHAGVRKFSDADYPQWNNGAQLVDASKSADSRCTEPAIRSIFNAKESAKAADLKLGHKVVKFHTEWDATNFDKWWGWLAKGKKPRLTPGQLKLRKAHMKALAFWKAANLHITPKDALPASHWHFHPRVFIEHFRKCGWFALDELAQLMPRDAGYEHGSTYRTGGATISFTTAEARFQPHLLALNRTLRKYDILDADRQSQFLAQTFVETGLWQLFSELGKGHPNKNGVYVPRTKEYYTVFYGRGIMQLTWAGNYRDYGEYRAFPHVASGHYKDSRLTPTSTFYWGDPLHEVHGVWELRHDMYKNQWFPRYDPDVVFDAFADCDSGGFYWVSKYIGKDNHGHHLYNINRVADRPFGADPVGRCSVLVNGGGYGFAGREAWAAYVHYHRGDDTKLPKTPFRASRRHETYHIHVDFTPQRP